METETTVFLLRMPGKWHVSINDKDILSVDIDAAQAKVSATATQAEIDTAFATVIESSKEAIREVQKAGKLVKTATDNWYAENQATA